MRLLRGVSGRVLDCGCLVGVYETYAGHVIATIDARGPACDRPSHLLHREVTPDDEVAREEPLNAQPSTPSRP
jgi:hypothetical protein